MLQPNQPQNNIDQDQKAKNFAKSFGLSFVKLTGRQIPPATINIIPKNVADEYKIIAYEFQERPAKTIKIAVANPEKLKQKAPLAIVELKKRKGVNIDLAITTLDDFNYAIRFYSQPQMEKPALPSKAKVSPELPELEKKEKVVKVPYLRPLPDKFIKPINVEEPTKKPLPDKPQPLHQEIKEKPQVSIAPVGKSNQVSLVGKKIPFAVLSKFPKDVAEKHQMVVFAAPLGTNLIKVGMLDPDSSENKQILELIKKKHNLETEIYKINKTDLDYAIGLYDKGIPPEIPAIEPLPDLEKNHLPPLEKLEKKPDEEKIKISPKPLEKKEEAKKVESEDVKGMETTPTQILAVSEEEEKNLDVILPNGVKSKENLAEIIKDGMVPKIVAAMIYFAVEQDASDIHLEPTNKDLRLRYRIDGILQDVMSLPLELHAPIISRIKIVSRLKIDETRLPQDGRFGVECAKKDIDIRVSCLPTVHGEKIVMRILDKSTGLKDIKELGFQGTNLKMVIDSIKKPYGIIFATGPTGCGKTTTLYSILKELNKPGVNIATFEDPVEYEIPGVNQCQIKPKIGFTFAEGLRSVVRQDPDIIMVGEVRDAETANMAVQAALTGHLVLSTLHTNTASGAMPRLINMGVEPFLITSAINCIIAQRLVRKICPKCKQKFQPPAPTMAEIKKVISQSKNNEILQYKDKNLLFYKGKGCPYCKDGYKGRIGIYEVLLMTAKLEDLSVRKSSADVLAQEAIAEGMVTLKQDGIIKALQGLTTLDEVLRETTDE